nr:molybdopterin-dependent oxidoreductase [Planctomonas sp. JC2975]
MVLAFVTGIATIVVGTAAGAWVAVTHGMVGIAVILLIPWKTRIAEVGMRRHGPSRWASLLLAVLTLITLVAGIGSATGLVATIAGQPAIWVHIFVALLMVPLIVWHVIARPVFPRRTDLSRRVLLRAGVIAVGAAGLYAATAATVDWLKLPGARRRFTGSYETASFNPDAIPVTSWILDAVPSVDSQRWRLDIVDAHGTRALTLAELDRSRTQVRATLDCTSGWYTDQDWAGVPLSALLHVESTARSVYVHSVTGYWIRYPVEEVDRLLLATHVGGARLTPDHGFPARIVAPGLRGYWWVKWVDRIELQTTPWWWQPPFPVG